MGGEQGKYGKGGGGAAASAWVDTGTEWRAGAGRGRRHARRLCGEVSTRSAALNSGTTHITAVWRALHVSARVALRYSTGSAPGHYVRHRQSAIRCRRHVTPTARPRVTNRPHAAPHQRENPTARWP